MTAQPSAQILHAPQNIVDLNDVIPSHTLTINRKDGLPAGLLVITGYHGDQFADELKDKLNNAIRDGWLPGTLPVVWLRDPNATVKWVAIDEGEAQV